MRVLAGFLAAVLATACSSRVGDLSIVASRNVGFAPEPLRRSVEGEDCVHVLIFIPIGSLVPNLDEATDRALAQVPAGNVMTDVAVYQDILFTFFYNRTCLRVKGDVGTLQ